MKILVLAKEVPDTYGDRRLTTSTGRLDRDSSEPVPDEIGERAVEVALAAADASADIEVVVVSMGPKSLTSTLRKLLAMGADRAVHVLDPGLAGADLGATARALAAAVRRIGFDLVVTGNVSTDGGGGVIGAMVAEHLGVPHLTQLTSVEVGASEVSGSRAVEHASVSVRAALPAVVSITEALPDPRFPNFRGIMAAKKKPYETWTLAELGLEQAGAHSSVVLSASERPARTAGIRIVDEGDAGVQLAAYLVSNGLA